MKELVELIAKSLVDHPDEDYCNRDQSMDDAITSRTERCTGDDMGKVIGKQGRIAKVHSYCGEGGCIKG